MPKTLTFNRRGFGGESDILTNDDLSRFIGLKREHETDITSFRLYQSIEPQIEAGIEYPCAGGFFYDGRLKEGIIGLNENIVKDELGYHSKPFEEDASFIRSIKNEAWFALPSPGSLGFVNQYYRDSPEFLEELCKIYNGIFRTMRDSGIKGHIIHAEQVDEIELELLSSRKVIFLAKNQAQEDLRLMLEYQKTIGLFCESIADLLPLFEEVKIHKIIPIGPDEGNTKDLLQWFDPENIEVGGYCSCDCSLYWKNLISGMIIP